jgi:ubiquinone/menaquinone biosynthesis C-methylase UbiE
MPSDTYAPGYSAPMLAFMGRRTAEIHAEFLLPHLRPGWRLLDAGCGPRSITLGLARAVTPGLVIGIDVEDAQFADAREQAAREALQVEFRKASVYEIPFEAGSFDAVFSHALMGHLSAPEAAFAEFRRILKPGGLIGVRAGDMGGILLDATSAEATEALAAYIASKRGDSMDPNIGRKLGRLLRQAGFQVQSMTASYEVITETLRQAGPSLMEQFAPPGYCSLNKKDDDDIPFIALAWCEVIASSPRSA